MWELVVVAGIIIFALVFLYVKSRPDPYQYSSYNNGGFTPPNHEEVNRARRKQVQSTMAAEWKAYVPEGIHQQQLLPRPLPHQQQQQQQKPHAPPPPLLQQQQQRSDSPPKKRSIPVYNEPPKIPLPMYGAQWGQNVAVLAKEKIDAHTVFPQQPQQPIPPPQPLPKYPVNQGNTPPQQQQQQMHHQPIQPMQQQHQPIQPMQQQHQPIQPMHHQPMQQQHQPIQPMHQYQPIQQHPPLHPQQQPLHALHQASIAETLPVFGNRGRDHGSGISEVEERATMHSIEVAFTEVRMGKLIGEGGFGKVYAGKWRGTTVAVKILNSQHLNDELVQEFRREVALMSALRHPNVVLLMGACVVKPNLAIITEMMSRGSLWNVLHDPSISLDWNTIYRMSRDAVCGLQYLHSFKPPILHRDLKSGNLLVDNGFNVKLSDFGLSRVRSHTYTMTGQRGTFQWMAPEVLANARYSESADVYSFGIIVWEMCTRDLPYNGLNPMQAAMGVLNQGLRPTIPSYCPQPLAQLMQHCWQTSPEKRPPTSSIVDLLETLC